MATDAGSPGASDPPPQTLIFTAEPHHDVLLHCMSPQRYGWIPGASLHPHWTAVSDLERLVARVGVLHLVFHPFEGSDASSPLLH